MSPVTVAVASAYYAYNSFVSRIPFYCIRHWYLRNIMKIPLGRGCAIHMNCFFSGRHVVVGNNSIINRNVYIDGRSPVEIGNNVSISLEAMIFSMTHDIRSAGFDPVRKTTRISDFAWVGARAMILPGITIGKGAVVGAGAVVTRDVEPFEIVAGVPAKKIGERRHDLSYTLKYRPLFNSDLG